MAFQPITPTLPEFWEPETFQEFIKGSDWDGYEREFEIWFVFKTRVYRWQPLEAGNRLMEPEYNLAFGPNDLKKMRYTYLSSPDDIRGQDNGMRMR